MYKIKSMPKSLILGYFGESNIKEFEVDCTDWLTEWPDGTIVVTYQAPSETRAYPLPPSQSVVGDGILTIIVRSNMTSEAGSGTLNIRLVDDNATPEDLDDDIGKRSVLIRTTVLESHETVLDEAPDIVRDWVDEATLLNAAVTEEEADRVEAEEARAVWEAYDNANQYEVGNKVSYEGSSYICVLDSLGNLPTDETYWLMIARRGYTYLPSFELDDGYLMAMITETYNLGRVAYVNKGAYSAATVYDKYDVVLYQNGSYAYINDTSAAGNAPTNVTYWEVMLDPTDMNLATTAANDAAQDALDGIIASASVSGDDLLFTTADSTVHTATGAMADVNAATDAANTATNDMRYMHLKYSVNEPTADGDISNTPGNWLGIYIGVSHTAPTTYTSYTWRKISGIHVGDDAPTANEGLWVDTDEPDILVNNQDLLDAIDAANSSGPVSASRTVGDGTPGTTDTYTIVYGNGNTTSYDVYNGADAPSLAGVHQYIIRWDKVNAECTRMGDAAAITTVTTNFGHFGATNPTYDNPFDELYPWKYRKLCKVDRAAYALLAPGSDITEAVTAWEGEPGFTLDGTGDFDGVYTPEFWARDWEDATYRYIGVADGPIPGWQYFEATIGGRYFGSMDGSSKITSIANAIPLRNTLMSTMHTNVTSQGMTLDDIFTWCADNVLMAVEYACLNSQQVLGNGCDTLYRQSAETIGEAASAGATLLKLPNAFAAYCVAGAVIGIGTENGGETVDIVRFVSSADLDAGDPLFATHKAVTITPLTNPVTTAHFVSVHGTYNAPDIEIGSKSGYIGSNTKVNAYYRGRVAHGNYWRYVLGAYRQTGTGEIWVANSRTEAAAYDALNTGVHRNTGKALPTTSNYIATLHADNLLPLVPFAATTGGAAGSGDPVGDYCYVPSLATGNTILRLGGSARDGVSDGRFCGYWGASAGVSAWGIAVLPFLKTP
jgi:hypothetical protein